ncbi:MAG: Holliday junction resolvase RuvX [Chlorobiaceae bacterium]|nr:Holliday junction resolvase RuvX [Chlorobiaceae bacterium]
MPPQNYKRTIGIDFGTKRIGLAKSDPLGMFAQPVGTFDMKGLVESIEKIRVQDGIAKIIVGYPLNEQGGGNRMTSVIDRFIEELSPAFPGIPIETIDEHRSSKDAMQILVGSGTGRKKRNEKGRLDTAAACIILQSYLDSRR